MARPDEVNTRALARRANVTDAAARDWQQGKPVTARTAAKLAREVARMEPARPDRGHGVKPPARLSACLRVLMNGPATVKHVAEVTQTSYDNAKQAMVDLRQRGVVTHASPLWAIADVAEARRIIDQGLAWSEA